MTDLAVFTFAGDWGLPSTGPFALKLTKSRPVLMRYLARMRELKAGTAAAA